MRKSLKFVFGYPGIEQSFREGESVNKTVSLTQGLRLFKKKLSLSTAAAAAKSLQSCPTLCDLIDGSPAGSTVPGILQARTLEWVAISFSNV